VLVYAARDALRPALEVYVVPVVPKSQALRPEASVTPEAGASLAAHAGTSTSASAAASSGAVLAQAPGWVEPAPYPVIVPALAEGVVREVLVLEGQPVAADQVVVRMIDQDAQLLLRAAEAALAQRRADADRARADIATAEAQIRVEQAAAEEVRDNVNRSRPLVASGAVGAADFRASEIRLGGMEAKVAAARRAADAMRSGLAQAEAALASAAVTRDEAALRLSRMEVRSPVAGVVMSRLVEPGTRIAMDSTNRDPSAMSGAVLRLYNPQHLQVRVDVPLADAAKISIGTRAIITTESLPGQTFTGSVVRAIHEANIQRNTVQFKVELESPSPVMKPEMLTRVKLVGTSAQPKGTPAEPGHTEAAGGTQAASITAGDGTLLVLPASVLSRTGEGKATVWLVDSAGGAPVARLREVATEPTDDTALVAITAGLRLADRVVIDAPAGLRDGVRLKVLGERTSGTTP
jgi:multidrug resistance efflux pump